MLAQRALTRRRQGLRVRARDRVGERASPSEHDSDWSSAFDGRAPGTRPRGSSWEKEGGGVLLVAANAWGCLLPFLGLCCLPPCCCCSWGAGVTLRAWNLFLDRLTSNNNLASTTALCVASSASVRWTCTKTCRSCVRTGTRSWCSRTKVATSSAFPSWMMKPPRHVSRTPRCLLPRAQRRPISIYPRRVSQLWDRFHAHIRMRFRRRHVPLCLIRIRG